MADKAGKLITVIGNSGVGKTTFVKALCTAGGYASALEQHAERPFQQRFVQELTRYALPNQVDYLLFRAEQELVIRSSASTGIIDGGLDQDFFVFTHLFQKKGYLSQAEFALCQRVYHFCREFLPSPDLTVWLDAPLPVITERYASRGRALQIVQIEDLVQIEKLLQEWMDINPPTPLLHVDVATEGYSYTATITHTIQVIGDR
jgi:deoxyadenosine/deoxycytidine kinase